MLYISYDGMTDPLGQSQVLPYLQGIAESGYDIHLLSFEKKKNLEKENQLIQDTCNKSGITWHPRPYTAKPPVLSSIYDFLEMRSVVKQLHKKYAFNLVHCRSYLTGMAGMLLKKKFGVKFLLDIRGFWADERVEGGLWNLRNPVFNSIYHFFKIQEKQMFIAADGIISLTAKAVPIIREIQDEASGSNPIEVIPCCVDTHLFNPATIREKDREVLRKQLNLPDGAFTLCYLGGIGTWYKAAEMFDFFNRLLLRFPEARCLFITREREEILQRMAAERNIPSSRIIVKAAARKEVPLYLSLADASIYFIMDSFSKQASSPTKQGEIMSMGIPLICNPGVGDSSDILEANSIGYICRGYNAEAYDKIINTLEFPAKPEEKKHLREVALQNFSLEDGIRKYLAMYQRLIRNDDKAHSLE